jgi:TPR repeat protein
MGLIVGLCLLLAGGFLYLRGEVHATGLTAHGEHRFDDAMPMLKAAAVMGVSEAAGLVGVMYLFGQGTHADGARAEWWLLRASNAGVTSAQTLLGTMYAKGLGVAIDLTKARTWLQRASTGGDPEATFLLRTMTSSKPQT